jgi:hypothetical protein
LTSAGEALVDEADGHRKVVGSEEHLTGTDFAQLADQAQPRTLVVVEARGRPVAIRRFLDASPEWLGHTRSGTMNATSST